MRSGGGGGGGGQHAERKGGIHTKQRSHFLRYHSSARAIETREISLMHRTADNKRTSYVVMHKNAMSQTISCSLAMRVSRLHNQFLSRP